MKICAGPLQTDVWDRLGKPDFRRARLIVENFLPAGLRPYLPSKALRLLAWLVFLFWLQGTGKSPHKGVHPKQAWLGQKVGCGKWWTCHLVGRLRLLGLVESYRSYHRGRASVLVYFPGGMLF